MVGMNKAYIWESVMPTWVILYCPFLHRKLILRSCISHAIFKIAIAVYSSTILAKRMTSAEAPLKIPLIVQPALKSLISFSNTLRNKQYNDIEVTPTL